MRGSPLSVKPTTERWNRIARSARYRSFSAVVTTVFAWTDRDKAPGRRRRTQSLGDDPPLHLIGPQSLARCMDFHTSDLRNSVFTHIAKRTTHSTPWPASHRQDHGGRWGVALAYNDPALCAECRPALRAHPSRPSHQHRQRPDRQVPRLPAALLRTRLEEPCRLRPMARRPGQRGPLLPRRAQAAARLRPQRQHGLLTPPRHAISGGR